MPRAGKPALFLLHSMGLAGEVGECRVDPPLVVRDAQGRRTPECLSMREAFGIPG